MGELRRTTSSIEIWEWRKDTRNAIGSCTFSHIVRDSTQFVTHLYPHSSWLIHIVCNVTPPNATASRTANPTLAVHDEAECCCQAQSAKLSNVSFATFQWKETFELWALSFETAFGNVTSRGSGCTFMDAIVHMCCTVRDSHMET